MTEAAILFVFPKSDLHIEYWDTAQESHMSQFTAVTTDLSAFGATTEGKF